MIPALHCIAGVLIALGFLVFLYGVAILIDSGDPLAVIFGALIFIIGLAILAGIHTVDLDLGLIPSL